MNSSIKAGVFASAILLFLISARAFYTMTTGYILPDEAFYLNLMTLNGGLGFSVYRPILHVFYAIFFTGFNSLPDLALRGALFCSVWALGCVFALSKVLKALEIADKPSALVILSFVLMPVFPLMAVFFVTETMALFFGLAGMYFSIRYVKQGGWKPAGLAALMFLFASQVREPYMLFLVATPLALMALRRPKVKEALSYGIPLLVGLPFPSSLHPLSLNQPISDVVFEFIPNYLLAVVHSIHWAGLVPSWTPSSVGGVGPASSASIPSYVFAASNSVHITVNAPAFQAFGTGLVYGINPFFAGLLFVSLGFALWKRTQLSILMGVFAVFSIVSYFVVADFAVEYLPDATTLWLSNIIRLSSAALPAAVGLGYLYSRTGPKLAYACLMGTLVLGGAFLPSFSSAIQSSQNIQGGNTDRLSLDYRAPYFRMYQILQPGDLVLTGSTGIDQLSVFSSMLRNITVQGFPANQSGFDALLSEKWNHVYLFDSWVNLNPAFFKQCQCYPSYLPSILLSGGFGFGNENGFHSFAVQHIWADGESYALEVTKYVSSVDFDNFGNELYVEYNTNHSDPYGISQAFYGLWFHTTNDSIALGPVPCSACGPGGSAPLGFSGLIPKCPSAGQELGVIVRFCFGTQIQVVLFSDQSASGLSIQWQDGGDCDNRIYIAQSNLFIEQSNSIGSGGICGEIGVASTS